jgi:iron(III) transport system permease protein
MEPLLRRYRTLRLTAIVAFLAFAYGPTAAIIATTLGEPAMPLAAVFSPRRIELLLRSLGLSLSVALAATLIGLLAAIGILRHFPRRAAIAQWLLLATIALPPTIPAMAWGQFLAFALPTTAAGSLGNWAQAAMVQALAALPFATGIALVALRAVDPTLIDAARNLARPSRVLLTVALPLAWPTLIAGMALVFLVSLLDYTIPSIFGANVYAMEIFVAFSATHSSTEALWLSLPLLACALTLVLPLAGIPRRLGQLATGQFPADGELARPMRMMLVAAAVTGALAAAAPLLSLLPALADPAYLGRTLLASSAETGYTLATSSAAALFALLLAVAPALEIARGGATTRLLWVLSLLPFLMPPALTGIGLISLWSPVEAVAIYGSPWMTIAAEATRFAPVAVIVLAAALGRVDHDLIEAALVAAASPLRAFLGVALPLALPGLAAALGLCFVMSLGEIGANLLVTPPGAATLTMKTYNYLHYGGSQAAAGLCLLLTLTAALGAGLPALLVRARSLAR